MAVDFSTMIIVILCILNIICMTPSCLTVMLKTKEDGEQIVKYNILRVHQKANKHLKKKGCSLFMRVVLLIMLTPCLILSMIASIVLGVFYYISKGIKKIKGE